MIQLQVAPLFVLLRHHALVVLDGLLLQDALPVLQQQLLYLWSPFYYFPHVRLLRLFYRLYYVRLLILLILLQESGRFGHRRLPSVECTECCLLLQFLRLLLEQVEIGLLEDRPLVVAAGTPAVLLHVAFAIVAQGYPLGMHCLQRVQVGGV